MKKTIIFRVAIILAIFTVSCKTNQTVAPKPILPSWEESNAKRAIINFMFHINRTGKERIGYGMRTAVIEFDKFLFPIGTEDLETEFLFYSMEVFTNEKTHLKDKTPYKQLIAKDRDYLYEQGGYEKFSHLVNLTWQGKTMKEYEAVLNDFYEKYCQKKGVKRFSELISKKGVELIRYLKDNKFRVYVYTDCDVDLVRKHSNRSLKLLPEYIIGPSVLFAKDTSGRVLRTNRLTDNSKEIMAGMVQRRLGGKPMFMLVNGADISVAEIESTFYIENLALIYSEEPSDSLKQKSKENGWVLFH